MVEGDGRVSLAIDGGHNIREDTEAFLEGVGFRFNVWENGKLHVDVLDDPLLGSITINRGEDISLRLDEGVNNFAIYGRDQLREAQLGGLKIEELADLGFSTCWVVTEVPINSQFHKHKDLNGVRIATHLPNTTRDYYKRRNVDVRIVQYSGKEEGAPAAGAADAVVAIYKTGKAAIDNELRLLGRTRKESTILESAAVLAASTKFLQERGSDLVVSQFIDRVRMRTRRPKGFQSSLPLGNPPIILSAHVQQAPIAHSA